MELLGTAYAGRSFVIPVISTGIEGVKPRKSYIRLNPKTLEKSFEEVLIIGGNSNGKYKLLGQIHTDRCNPIENSPDRTINVQAAKLKDAVVPKFYATIDSLRQSMEN